METDSANNCVLQTAREGRIEPANMAHAYSLAAARRQAICCGLPLYCHANVALAMSPAVHKSGKRPMPDPVCS